MVYINVIHISRSLTCIPKMVAKETPTGKAALVATAAAVSSWAVMIISLVEEQNEMGYPAFAALSFGGLELREFQESILH